LQEAYQRQLPMLRQNAKYLGDSNESLNKYSAASDFSSADIEKNGMKAAKTQDAQINKTDELTNSTVKAQQNIEKMNTEFSKLAITLLPNAAKAIESMTGAMVKFINYANEKFGGSAAPAGGSGSGQPGISGEFGGGDTGAGAGPAQLTQKEKMAGLRLKSAEAVSGGDTSDQLAGVARAIQDKLGGNLKYFSAFNDSYERGPNSLHGRGRALDFTLNDPSMAASVASMISGIPGISKVIDEYANPTKSATGGHIHAEISAARGAILSGPSGGYKPNLTMHGTEAVIPLNSPAAQSMGLGGGENTGLMAAQLEKLEEMVSVMKNQLAVSTKIMQYAS
jgi:hypothetical protein